MLPRVITGVLALWLSLDVGGRFLPVGWLGVLPEHEATRRPGRYSPFIPGLTLANRAWHGETATTGNLPPRETRSPIQFSTDSLGFRKTPGVSPDSPVELILRDGASFAYGGGLSDHETLPAVLSAAGLPTYNGGRFFWDPLTYRQLEWMLGRFQPAHPAILALAWEQTDYELSQLEGLPWRLDAPGRRILGDERWAEFRETVQYTRRRWSGFWQISPLEIGCVRLFKWFGDDVLLPNRYRAAVESRSIGGQRMLFLASEVERSLHPPGPERVARNADFFLAYQRWLAQRGHRLFVVLLPNRYTLYGPVADGPRAASPYLGHFAQALAQRGVPVLNMLPVFQAHTSAELASGGPLSFYREDHHWSPSGVRLTAQAVLAEFFPDRGAR